MVKTLGMNCLFIYNPNSGKGKISKQLPLIRRKLSEKYDRVEVVAAESAEDLQARVKAADCDVVFSGGDGTFHAVLQAAEGKTLGYLPSGTVNDVARSLGIPRTVKGALDVILKGRPETVDCMATGKSYSAYVAAAGAFTETTYNTPQTQKKLLGPLAYAIHGIRHGLPLKVFPVEIVCDGRTVKENTVLILVLNGRSVAGFPVNRAASMRDGKMEVVLIRQAKRPNFLKKMGAFFSIGTVFLFGIRIKKRDILFLQGRHVSIKTEATLVWDLDGEEGPRGNIDISLAADRVKLYLPPS